MTIFKYPLEMKDRQALRLPYGAEILSVGNQRGNLMLWARVGDSDHPDNNRTIEIIGTGNPMPNAARKFIGTVVIEPFVWHVFEVFG